MRNLIRMLRGQPVQLSPKQEAKMAKAQARADAMIAEAEAKGRAAQLEAAPYTPGGVGFDPNRPPPIGDMLKQAFQGFQDSVGEMFDDREGIIDRDPGANMNKPPPELEDPAERDRVAATERAARDLARAPYLAAAPPAIAFTRVGTTGRTQLEEVVEALRASGLSAAPERVFGVYRVPDRFDHNKNSENRAYVEWEIAHAPGALAPAADDVLITAFAREDHWVARRVGEPSVLDEDVAGTLCARAGLEPEDCFGLPRLLQIRGSDSEAEGKIWQAHVDGALVFSRPSEAVTRAHEQLMGEAPLALAARPVLPFYSRDPRLGVGRRVGLARPQRAAARPVAAAAPPEHVAGADDRLPRGRRGARRGLLRRAGHARRHGEGHRRPLDGEHAQELPLGAEAAERRRHGPRGASRPREIVVVAYRDRAEYQEGRARWGEYQDEVLRAKLDHLTRRAAGHRRRVPPHAVVRVGGLRHVQPARSDGRLPDALQPQPAAGPRALLREAALKPPLDAWQVGPGNRWAYQHVDEMVPTVVVSRGDGAVLDLPARPLDLDVGDFLETQYVDGLAVLHEGALVLEAYRNEMQPETLHLSQSVGKSVLGLLVGILQLDPATPVVEYVPEVAGSGYAGATVQHLLDMTAAIDFVEDYATFWRYDVACAWHPPHPDAPANTILEYLPTIGPAADWAHGERLHYSTPNTDLLGLVAERAGGAPLAELIARELWAPLGAERDALLTVDTRGDRGDRRRLLRDAARLRAARGAGAARRRRARPDRAGSRGSASGTRVRSTAAASRPRGRAATGCSGGGSRAARSRAASTGSSSRPTARRAWSSRSSAPGPRPRPPRRARAARADHATSARS